MIDPEAAVQNASSYLAGADPRGSLTSPALVDLSGLPPLLVQVGDDEVLLGDSEKIATGIRAGGGQVTLTVWKEMGRTASRSLPEAERAISDAAAFMKAHWA